MIAENTYIKYLALRDRQRSLVAVHIMIGILFAMIFAGAYMNTFFLRVFLVAHRNATYLTALIYILSFGLWTTFLNKNGYHQRIEQLKVEARKEIEDVKDLSYHSYMTGMKELLEMKAYEAYLFTVDVMEELVDEYQRETNKEYYVQLHKQLKYEYLNTEDDFEKEYRKQTLMRVSNHLNNLGVDPINYKIKEQ